MVGSMTSVTSATRFAGRPPCLACSRMVYSSGAKHSAAAVASPYTMAAIYAGLGENDRALESLKKVCLEKSLGAGWIRSDPLLDSLRSDPRFQDLLRRVGLT